jgi:hypothetical protein
MTTETTGWRLTDEDRGVLENLRQAVHPLLRLARTGQDVIGVGETIDAIENILSSSDIEVNVGLETGFRRGNDDFEEGLFVCLRINDEEIVLDELHTTYSKDVGGDHFTITHATLTPEGCFNDVGVWTWIDQLREVCSFDDATMEVSRDHV